MRVLLALFVGLLVGCSSSHDDDHEHEEEGKPSGATCDTSAKLTYESVGKPFVEKYCTRCHDSKRTGASRNGAPDFHDFDTRDGILAVAAHVDQKAAAGPQSVNAMMPPSDPRPTEEERRRLGVWLACETAAMK